MLFWFPHLSLKLAQKVLGNNTCARVQSDLHLTDLLVNVLHELSHKKRKGEGGKKGGEKRRRRKGRRRIKGEVDDETRGWLLSIPSLS